MTLLDQLGLGFLNTAQPENRFAAAYLAGSLALNRGDGSFIALLQNLASRVTGIHDVQWPPAPPRRFRNSPYYDGPARRFA